MGKIPLVTVSYVFITIIVVGHFKWMVDLHGVAILNV